jgi:peroxiredoxin
MGAEVIAISTDNVDSLVPWASHLGVTFVCAADFWPHGSVSQQYGVFNPYGVANRAIVLIDQEGKIRFMQTYGEDELPPVEPVVEALRGLGS